ncbi:hypothetical protein B9Z19DRAFT_1119681 [Tuber borchii]|uniref:Aspartic peptidase domain-containing protein n=1 Tax=Tuber borchii TaxID=42251 RepID=A0A2T7A696_TUBBO|nr:hypothetical protein B9Z19DRAFT_1119681 [Tuber borchii]
MSPKCEHTPISVALTNYTLPSQALFRGFQVLINGQRFSLRPDVSRSDIHVANTEACSRSQDPAGCLGALGGLFNTTGLRETIDMRWNGTGVFASTDVTVKLINTFIEFGNSSVPKLYGVPVVVENNTVGDSAGLALGVGSSFLRAVVNAGLIPSMSWGLGVGSRSVERPTPGDLTLGGFNRSWISGESEFRTFKISNVTGCPLRVMVEDIAVGSPGQKKTSLFDSDFERYYACINPFQNRFSLTRRMISQLMNLTGHEPVADDPDAIYYEGDKAPRSLGLTIKLDNLTSTTPPYELWNLKRGAAPSTTGTYSILSNTTYEIGVKSNFDSSAGKETEILLGAIFLSTMYLVVDIEAGIFKLAPINPTSPSAKELQPICPETQNPKPSSREAAIFQAAIAGFVLFGIAVVVILFLWFRLRKHKKSRSRQDDNQEEPFIQNQEVHGHSKTSSASCEAAEMGERETRPGDIENKADVRVKTEGVEPPHRYGSIGGSSLSPGMAGAHGPEGVETGP